MHSVEWIQKNPLRICTQRGRDDLRYAKIPAVSSGHAKTFIAAPGCLLYNVRLSAPEESAESVCMVRFSIAILMSRESIRRFVRNECLGQPDTW